MFTSSPGRVQSPGDRRQPGHGATSLTRRWTIRPRRALTVRVVVVAVAAALAVAGCDGGSSANPMPTFVAAPSGAPSGSPSGAPQPAPSPSVSPPLSALAIALSKLPHFPPAPAPVAIEVPKGPTAPIYFRLPVTAKVAFLTMDDGLDQLAPNLALMKAAHIPFTMFLIAPVAAKNPGYFKQLENDGGLIEDHTLTHPILRGRTYAYQKNQICGARTILTSTFGRAPVLFRPPFGDYDTNTLRVVHDCGLKAAFYWSETVNDGKVYYQTSVHKIRAGDIILMHFRPAFLSDVIAALTAIHKAGLTPALLENYIS